MNIAHNVLPSRSRTIDWIDLHPLRILGLILILAFAMNMGELVMNPPTIQMGDAEQWWEVAVNVSIGAGYIGCYPDYFPFCSTTNQVTAAREPLPVLVFALVARLTNDSLFAAGFVQLIVNLLIVVAVYLLTRELANRRIALLAALLWALYLPAIYYVPEVGSDLMATLGITFALFFFLRALTQGQARYWAAAGVSLGLATLSRTSVLVFAPALMLGLVLWYKPPVAMPERLNRWKAVLVFASALGVVQLPWVVRNYAAFGRPVIGTTLVGYNLYRESYDLGMPGYLHYVEPNEAQRAIQALVASRPDLHGHMNEVQMNAVYLNAALRIIASHPVEYAKLSAYRFLMLWFNWGVGQTQKQRLGDIGVAAGQLVLMVLAGLGALRWRRTWPLIATILVTTIGYMLIVARLRYVIAVMPLTVALAAMGAAYLAVRIKSRVEAGNATDVREADTYMGLTK